MFVNVSFFFEIVRFLNGFNSNKKGEDFNQFGCGNFIKSKRMPAEASSIEAFSELRGNLAGAVAGKLFFIITLF
jgi:hypothetical protein